MSIILNNYTLHFDGSITVDPSKLLSYVGKLPTSKIFVTELTPDIISYNKTVRTSDKIKIRGDDKIDLPSNHWMLDDESNVSDSDIFTLICEKLACKFNTDQCSKEYQQKATTRVLTEWKLFKEKGMVGLLRALLTTINTLTKKHVAWGPGRGSSTSSYILYIIGLHDVDCVLYDVDITDFIKG